MRGNHALCKGTAYSWVPVHSELLGAWVYSTVCKLGIADGCRYDRQKCEPKEVQDMQLLAAMAPPSGGRNPFSQRIQVTRADMHVAAGHFAGQQVCGSQHGPDWRKGLLCIRLVHHLCGNRLCQCVK